ncbi:MAG: deoxyribose-phosphate aldolase [Saprospiraceae bacterium]
MNLAQYIDHTNLSPIATATDIKKLCEEAITLGCKAVCVAPYHVSNAFEYIGDSKVLIATVAGFPFGYSTIPPKVEELKKAIDNGAKELDVVVNLAAVKEKRWNYVQNEIEILTTTCHLQDKIIKVIFETGVLTRDEIVKLCEICTTIGVNFVKTSTGFNGAGATVEAVQIMKANLPSHIGIKASGGIRSIQNMLDMIQAGATRIGTSSAVSILQNKN